MQLESSHHTNTRKRKASVAFDDEFDYLYGIVTTASDCELEAKNAKLEAEKAELLKQVMEKDAKRDVENTELKSRVGELEARLAILEQSPPIVNGQPENDKEVSSEVSVVVVPGSSPIHEVHNHLKLTEQIEEVLKVPDQEKTSEDMETDAFLVEAHKKNIGDEIRKRNKEKKLNKAVEDQVSLQKISDTASSISSSEKLVSTKNGQGLIQEISRNLAESATPSSIQENDSTCALSLNPPEISVISDLQKVIDHFSNNSNSFTEPEFSPTSGRPNHVTKISETIANSSLSADEKDYLKMITGGIDDETAYWGAPYENEARVEKEEVNEVKGVQSDNDVYFEKNFVEALGEDKPYFDDDPIPQPEKGTNEVKSDDENDSSNSEDEIPDDSDDDGYNGYGGYNEYGECGRGYYYHDGGYERKTSPMMSPIISPKIFDR
ncbi:unnamed protein product [Rhizophagus irregularis]|nr:unnamed protein product [Rhizophagus irregularis]